MEFRCEIDQLLHGESREYFSESLLDGLDKASNALKHVIDRLNEIVTSSSLVPTLQQLVSSSGSGLNQRGQRLVQTGEEILSTFKVTKYKFPRLSPTRLSGLFQRIPQLGKRFNLGCRVRRGLTKLEDSINLLIGVAYVLKLLSVSCYLSRSQTISRHCELGQGFGENISGKPSATKSLSERSLVLDHLINVHAMNTSSLLQSVLEYLTTHTCVHDRVPVHKLYSTGSQRLRKLVHCGGCLLGGRTRHCGQVSNTLDRIYRGVQVNTGRGKRTNVSGHLCEVVDRLIRVGVQCIQRVINIIQSRTLALGIRQDGLYCVYLGFILAKTGLYGVNTKCRRNGFTSVYCRVRDVGKSGSADYTHGGEFRLYCVNRAAQSRHVDFLSSVIDLFQTLSRAIEIQAFL